MEVASFIMRVKKRTPFNNCFRESADRIGRMYLPHDFIQGDKLTIQIAKDKSFLKEGGYQTILVFIKETPNKVRYVENISEAGELGDVYVSKKVLDEMGIKYGVGATIAVRVGKFVEDENGEYDVCQAQ